MNQENKKALKKVWNTPNFVQVSVEETLSGTFGVLVHESYLYTS